MSEEANYRSYRDSGVDVTRGDECSRIAYRACRKTFGYQDLLEPKRSEGGFAGSMRINLDLRGASLVKNSDGVGTKALVAQRVGRYDTLGYDLIAMLADDTASTGAVPVVGTNTIDMARAEPELVEGLMDGLVDACEVADVSMVGGEVAEVPDQVKGYSDCPFIWNGDMIGLMEPDREIDGSRIEPGQAIVGLRGNGIRANGLTLARSICRSAFGPDWHGETFNCDVSWGEVLLEPSRIFAPIIAELTGGFTDDPRADITGIVHVTGGGLENLNRVIPDGTGACMDNLFPAGDVFIRLQELGPVAEKEAYRTWNMGQPLLLVTPNPGKVRKVLRESGVVSRVVGEITDGEGVKCSGRGAEGEEFVV